MNFDWQFVLDPLLPALVTGLRTTVIATIGGYLLALALGLVAALLRRSPVPYVGRSTYWVMEFIRCTPLLVQLFFVFYVFPGFGLTLSPLAAGIIGLGVHYAAYTAEVYRSGIEGVPKGQWEACRALSLSPGRIWASVVLPQAVRKVIPPLGNYLIAMFKDTPLLFAITVPELLSQAQQLAGRSFRYFEAMTMVGVLFIVISVFSSLLIRRMERRYAAV